MKKIISILTAMLLVIALLPTDVFAGVVKPTVYVISQSGDSYSVNGGTLNQASNNINTILQAIKTDSSTLKVLQFGDNSTVTLQSTVIDFDCTITGFIEGSITIETNAYVKFNAMITDHKDDYALLNEGSLNIDDATVNGNILNSGKLLVSGGTVNGNILNSEALEISGGTVNGNFTSYGRLKICQEDDNKPTVITGSQPIFLSVTDDDLVTQNVFEMTGGKITCNSDNSAIYNHGGGDVSISGGTIEGNSTCISSNRYHISNLTISNSTMTSDSGTAIEFNNDKSALTINNSEIKGDTNAISFGSNLEGKLTINNSKLSSVIYSAVDISVSAVSADISINGGTMSSPDNGCYTIQNDSRSNIVLNNSPVIKSICVNEDGKIIIGENGYTGNKIKVMAINKENGDKVIENCSDKTKFESDDNCSEFIVDNNNLILDKNYLPFYSYDENYDNNFITKLKLNDMTFDKILSTVGKEGFKTYLYYYQDDGSIVPILKKDDFPSEKWIHVFGIKDNTVTLSRSKEEIKSDKVLYSITSGEYGIASRELDEMSVLVSNLLPVYNIKNPTIKFGEGTDEVELNDDFTLGIDCTITGKVKGNIIISDGTTVTVKDLETENPVQFKKGSKLIVPSTDTGSSIYDGDEKINTAQTFTEDTDVAVKPTEYNINYELNGGVNASNPATYTFGKEVVLKNPTKKGYTFKGWFNGSTNVDSVSAKNLGDITLTAKWEVNKYTVTFNEGVKSQKIEYSKFATVPTEPVKNDYIFVGWYSRDELFDFATPITDNVTLTARWAKKIKMLEGDNSKWTQGCKEGLTFRSEADLSDFENVTINGIMLDESNFTKKSGSTIITLKSEYLDTLSTGTYTIAINSITGTAKTTFNVVAKPAETNPDNPVVKPMINDNKSDSTSNKESKTDSANPKTGSNIPVSLIILSGFSLAGFVLTKKKINK